MRTDVLNMKAVKPSNISIEDIELFIHDPLKSFEIILDDGSYKVVIRPYWESIQLFKVFPVTEYYLKNGNPVKYYRIRYYNYRNKSNKAFWNAVKRYLKRQP